MKIMKDNDDDDDDDEKPSVPVVHSSQYKINLSDLEVRNDCTIKQNYYFLNFNIFYISFFHD